MSKAQSIAWLMLVLTTCVLLLPGSAIAAIAALLEPAFDSLRAWKSTWWPWPVSDPGSSGLALDKVSHFFLFALCGALFFRAWQFNLGLVRILAILLAFGVATEIAQYFIPGRSMSVGDMIADAVGLATGIFIYANIRRIKAA
ncbi:MAG: VanZ family protein [Pseudohongiella sp.]|uniref:VanZ family protein n=1 Tax=Pseudohongiella sp. TaxID=1979412 RepID=UPI00349FECD3